MKKIITAGIIAIAIVTLSGCAGMVDGIRSMQAMQNCQYELTSVTPEVTLTYPLSKSTVNLTFDVNVKNPNPSSINMTKLGFDLLIDDTKVYSGVTDYNVSIPANSTGTIKIHSKFAYNDLQKTFLTIARAVADSKATYQINGTAYYNTILGEVNFPMTLTKGEVK
jgi:LEA14-like dessication related protein